MQLTGVWLPIITPFQDDKIDYKSYKRLIDYYVGKGISGIIPLGTTGEIPTLSDYEFEEMIAKTEEYVEGRLPIYAGVGGNCTTKVINKVKLAEKYKIEGILSVCPYYNRPNQEGIHAHFKSIAEASPLNIIVYNIPYRTGTNIENETIHRLAEYKNIVGLKDSCGDIKQTMSLLLNTPKDFSILTGEDILFYLTLTLGGHGGILASSHLNTETFVDVYEKVKNNDTEAALQIWKQLYEFIPLLFKEPNPAPIKYCLSKLGLIESSELRLPLTQISAELQEKLDRTEVLGKLFV
ncbi:4-hydroxy-tetrahydrodipicolinate synthase 2 [Anaerocolumna cellulosilytica]|uniref:4-hydroxy-tetrahydrodipicolinate synthase n=1 Tax=Anaerocolumna cellulosilytica TaxID=433286 RepID=A0A6S6QSP9_9FIRM|nr:4-hydroxy-tetrahydrodipicolinate synthase [Anaerocolumna cellulosilytica]MBB5194665.1 4-hydroxy-tetrahydrodipicolinate synthase [Anaerocolumna cellulosilytica]BCJ94373.1 4-hydroxy-tetrahydrodipicolinate synthase 2 [Anaerocolumna cellulosilytica]